MKILFINDFAVQQGGAEILAVQLRDAMRARGHDARLFTSNAGQEGVGGLADYTCFGTTSRFRTLLQTANPWAAASLRRVLAEFRPDVVHVKMFLTQLSPLILPPLRTVPALYHVVWYRPICPLGTKLLPDGAVCHSPPGLVCYRSGCLPIWDWSLLMFQMKLWRRWRNVFDLIVANSEPVRQRLMAEGIRPVELIRNGVEPGPVRSAMVSEPTVVFAGRLVREKGVDVLLRAFAVVINRVPDARLIIYGQGPDRPALEKLVAELNLVRSVDLLGLCSNEDVNRNFQRAWVVAVPSIWEEPFGHVAIEAMASGVAVVASNTGGLAEIVRDQETGFLIPVGDVTSLASALIQILANRSLAERLGRRGHEVASANFSLAGMVDRFLELYRSLQSVKKPHRRVTALEAS